MADVETPQVVLNLAPVNREPCYFCMHVNFERMKTLNNSIPFLGKSQTRSWEGLKVKIHIFY
jgi:hypothetical protein